MQACRKDSQKPGRDKPNSVDNTITKAQRKATQFSTDMVSTDLLHRRGPPGTPSEFLAMVVELGKRRKSQRLADQHLHPCGPSCGGDIAAEGTHGESGYRERARLCIEGHYALRLADEIQRSMKLGKPGFSGEQKEASNDWEGLCKDKSEGSLLQRLGHDNGNDVSEVEMKMLIDVLSGIFFPTTSTDAQMDVGFTWEDWTERPQELAEYRERCLGKPRIRICAFNYIGMGGHGNLNVVALHRLATILHELVHAYLDHYACRCKDVSNSYEENVNQSEGHGRAWQRIAASVELAAPEILGYPLEMGRFESLKLAWKHLKHWPSEDEVKSWQLKYTRRKEDEDEDKDKEVEGEDE